MVVLALYDQSRCLLCWLIDGSTVSTSDWRRCLEVHGARAWLRKLDSQQTFQIELLLKEGKFKHYVVSYFEILNISSFFIFKKGKFQMLLLDSSELYLLISLRYYLAN